jgi:toxin HigB-1
MNFTFRNKELEKLYVTGKSKKLKLPNDIIEKFFARLQQIDAANDIYDLWNDKGLNFEKLTNTENSYSMRLKIKYRLEMDIDWTNNELTIGDFIITDISNHYS